VSGCEELALRVLCTQGTGHSLPLIAKRRLIHRLPEIIMRTTGIVATARLPQDRSEDCGGAGWWGAARVSHSKQVGKYAGNGCHRGAVWLGSKQRIATPCRHRTLRATNAGGFAKCAALGCTLDPFGIERSPKRPSRWPFWKFGNVEHQPVGLG